MMLLHLQDWMMRAVRQKKSPDAALPMLECLRAELLDSSGLEAVKCATACGLLAKFSAELGRVSKVMLLVADSDKKL